MHFVVLCSLRALCNFSACQLQRVSRGHNTRLNHCAMPPGILFGLLSKSQNFQIMTYLENKLHLILIDFFLQISSYFNGSIYVFCCFL